jgi:co-chaperonin GroES (HSP10)
MIPIRNAVLALASSMALGCFLVTLSHAISDQAQEAQPPVSAGMAKPVGAVKAVSGNVITLTTDAGSTVNILVQNSTGLVRIAPGQKDLKDAVPIQLQEVHVGDRILARGKVSGDGKSVEASSIVLMKESDVTAKQERDREDWQKRGVGGLVSKVDPSNGTITLSGAALSQAKPVTIHISKSTIIRRYSPDSVKFDDAKPGTVDQISPGDQLRARGERSPDGTELAADEVVSGTFRNVAGLVAATDPGSNTITVTDLLTKKPATLRISTDSQLRKLPPAFAQRIAQRLRGENPDAAPDASASGRSPEAKASGSVASGNGGGSHSGALPDFQQMLKRMPTVTLADLQKGDAVMIVTTQGTANTQPTAITLLSGVETILSASPNSNRAAMLLSPWNLGGGGADAAGATQ